MNGLPAPRYIMSIIVSSYQHCDVLTISNTLMCTLHNVFSNKARFSQPSTVTRLHRPISQTVFMLSIAISRAEHVCATVIIKHNYMLMCNHKIVINIMLCLLNSTGHI